ncbi:hypothetical protein Sjap_013299 [Stephania japonica]|uniref:DEUBAD domain-containing protein n=1 Tax=Stephania japonica TaxID=461633 RepID=A0AAP0NXI5_9MAGN
MDRGETVMSSEEDELQWRSSASEFDEEEDEDDDDVDSGAGSDEDDDVSELGKVGEELCQVGDQVCSVPLELYDLPDLRQILSVDVWNSFLSEEDRFRLAEFLPDMEQETFMRTMKELFSGGNFHFGSPLAKLFEMLRGGLCEPRVWHYRQNLIFFQKRKHYHLLRNYHNSMISSLFQIKDAWKDCSGYGIEERLRVLNLMRTQRGLTLEDDGDLRYETDSSGREAFSQGLLNKKLKEHAFGLKLGREGVCKATPTLPSRGSTVTLQAAKYGEQNPKGILKLVGSNVHSAKSSQGHFHSSTHGSDAKRRLHSSSQNHYDLGRAHQGKSRSRGGDAIKEQFYETITKRYPATCSNTLANVGSAKLGKKHFLKSEGGLTSSNSVGLPFSLNNDALRSRRMNKNISQPADNELVSSKHDRISFDYVSPDPGRKGKHLSSRGGSLDLSAPNYSFSQDKVKDDVSRNGKRKAVNGFQSVRSDEDSDVDVRLYRNSSRYVNDTPSHSSYGIKFPPKSKRGSTQNGKMDIVGMGGMDLFGQSDETESDSSTRVDERDNINPFGGKVLNPSSVFMDVNQHFSGPKRVNKLGKKEFGVGNSSKKQGDFLHMPEFEQSLKGKKKGKVRDPHYLPNYSAGTFEDGIFSGLADFVYNNGKKSQKFSKNSSLLVEPDERIHQSHVKVYPGERRKKCKINHASSLPQSTYTGNYTGNDNDDGFVNDGAPIDRLRRNGRTFDAQLTYPDDGRELPLLGCNTVAKKRKLKADLAGLDGLEGSDHLNTSPEQQIDESSSSKKRMKRKVQTDIVSTAAIVSEKVPLDVDSETKPGKKPFTMIMPTVHTNFSFSIIQLLSAVRITMIRPLAKELSDTTKHHEKSDASPKAIKEEQNGMPNPSSQENVESGTLEHEGVPSLTLQEIVNRVKSNPGDPCILDTQEPLQDLIRGVLKIFSSKTAPLGAKGWKALVSYEKNSKCWSWNGPVSSSPSDSDMVEETSPEAWGLPHKMLVKLVDAFANWLKNGQETLQLIGSLPPPPLSLMQINLDEKERFRDLRAQKSLTTISPSSEEVRDYFRREEVLRYSVPDRAFAYTAADGRKSVVAPLKRCGGKPTSKARDHFMLKRDRPPHVTILCLVRDAASRLPGSIGTRADVCTLIRDSQYIVEDVSDAQVNQVVSGALDRLHYERDPCVQFDGERKLWVYLHREREEEDFEDDGTSSTKKWKRPRKEVLEQPDPGTVSVAYPGTAEQVTGGSDAGCNLSSDLNIELASTKAGERAEPLYNNLKPDEEEKPREFVASGHVSVLRGHPMGWDVLGLNSPQENKLLCLENSTNEDYEDETFNRDRPVGLVSASIS